MSSTLDGFTPAFVFDYFRGEKDQWLNNYRRALEKPHSDVRSEKPEFSPDGQTMTLRAKVVPSYKKTCPKTKKRMFYDVEVVIRKIQAGAAQESGPIKVSSALCTCAIGKSKRCAHVGLLLVYHAKNITRTDCPAAWKANNFPPTWDEEPDAPVPQQESGYLDWASDEDVKAVLAVVPKTPMAILHSEINVQLSEDWKFIDRCAVREVLKRCREAPSGILFEPLFALTFEERSKIEKMTQGQQGRRHWMRMRYGRFTASNMHQYLPAAKKFAQGTVQSLKKAALDSALLRGPNLNHMAAIQWGITHEDPVIRNYAKLTRKDVVKCGTLLDPTGSISATPDGIGRDCGTLIEVKCPYKARHQSVEAAATAGVIDCLTRPDNNSLWELKKGHRYYHQVQTQLYVWEKELCDFIVSTEKSYVIVHVKKDPEWAANYEAAKKYYFAIFLPQILKLSDKERNERVG